MMKEMQLTIGTRRACGGNKLIVSAHVSGYGEGGQPVIRLLALCRDQTGLAALPPFLPFPLLALLTRRRSSEGCIHIVACQREKGRDPPFGLKLKMADL